MTAPWHRRNPELLVALRSDLLDSFPGLRVAVVSDKVELVGTYALVDQGILIDEFRIAVELPADFPRALPTVRELDQRILHEARFHANADDGTLCVVLPDEYWLSRKRVDIVEFLGGPLRNYFLGFVHFQEFGSWPFGEHDHGDAGIVKFYGSLFGVAGRQRVELYLRILAKLNLRPFRKCPCGSGRRLSKCHWMKLMNLHKRVRPHVVRQALRSLRQGTNA